MPQSLPLRASGSGSPKSRPQNRVFRRGGTALITGCIWLGLIRSAQAQNSGALQVSARVLSVEPSWNALRQALEPASRLEGTSLAQVTRTVEQNDNPVQKSRRPRTIVTIAFVRN